MILDKKYLIIIIIFTSVILTIGIVSAADNTTNPTSSSADMETPLASTTPTYVTLHEEIQNTPENGELILNKDYTYDEDNDFPMLNRENYITINKTITINGNGHTINGTGGGAGFVILKGVNNVVIKNIIFNNCENSKNKHRIIDISDNTIIENCTFLKCCGFDITPGVITITGNNNLIKDCKFHACLNAMIYPTLSASEPLNGGIIYINGEYNKIINSNFTEYWTNYQFNREQPSYKIRGDIIYIEKGNNNIEKCDFYHPFIVKQGKTKVAKHGNIYIQSGENNITQCTFENSEPSVYGTFISANTSSIIHINECEFKRGGSSALYIGGNYSTLFNSQFIKCTGDAGKWTGSYGITKGCTFPGSSYDYITYWSEEQGQFIIAEDPQETENNNTALDDGNETNNNPTNDTTEETTQNNTLPSKTETIPPTPTSTVKQDTVKIKKVTPKITAKKKTFKMKNKVKKYTVKITVQNKALNKAIIKLKIKGKTYKVKTNKKGTAIFKIKNLNKKGKYRGIITFPATKYYNSKKVKTWIIVK